MAYRAYIKDSIANADGRVKFICVIQREEDDGEGNMVWTEVEHGRRSLVLNASAISAITQNESLTSGQKKARLTAMFRETAKGWGIDESDAANKDIQALVTFPVSVGLDV